MLSGTIKINSRVYSQEGKVLMEAHTGDQVSEAIVVGETWKLNALTRNGKELNLPYPVYIVTSAITPPPTPDSFQFARVRHFSQSPVEDYLNYMAGRLGNFRDGANDPSCFKYPFKGETYLYLTYAQELWWYNRLVESAAGSMTKAQLLVAWKNLVMPKKAFTNNRDLSVEGLILGSQPLRLEPVICTGATIKIFGNPYRKGDGFWYRNFEVIDMTKQYYKDLTWANAWWLIQPATSSVSIGTTGRKERINPFPKMAGDRDTPYFLWGKNTTLAYIREDWLDVLAFTPSKPEYPYMPYRTRGGVERFRIPNGN